MLSAGCWAYSLATRYTDILFVPKGEKALILATLLAATSLLSGWFYWVLLPRFIAVISKRTAAILVAAGALLIGTIFFVYYKPPPFPEWHKLEISAQPEKNPLSGGYRIEVISVNTIDLPEGTYTQVPISQFTYDGNWQGGRDAFGLVHTNGNRASLQFERLMQAGIMLKFQTCPSCGQVHVLWDGNENLLDLYSEEEGIFEYTLEPALNWRSADRTRKILVAGAMAADFMGTLALFMIAAIPMQQILTAKRMRLRNPGLLALCLLAILLLQIPAVQLNETVTFENPNLERAIRNLLKQPAGAISRHQLLTIVQLDAPNQNITSLAGIEFLPNLMELDLSGNHITDLSSLGNLKNLQKLNLRDNDIADLSPLASLSELDELNIHSNQAIQSIKPLAELSGLHTLIIGNLPIGNQINVLKNLTQLKHLNLRNCGIKDLEFLTGMTELEYLNLHSNPDIHDIRAIQNLSQLQTLILANVQVADQIEILAHLIQLHTLNLRNTGIEDLSPLSKLVNLKYLNLHSNSQIRSLLPLQNMTQLETLILAYVPVGEQSGIFEKFPELNRLNLRGCQISDLAFLGRLMSKGRLQNDSKTERMAALDIRDNLELKEESIDVFAAVRPYWENIAQKQPFALPFYSNLPDPTFSHASGFYEESFFLELRTDGQNLHIHYTVDGSEPNENSPQYSGPIRISSRAGEPNRYAAIESVAADWNSPEREIFKANLVRAKAIDPLSGETSATVTHTYFIGQGVAERYTLPIISLAVDPQDLFDPDRGIYVLGREFEESRQSGTTLESDPVVENFHRRGRDWERPVHFELIDSDGKVVFNQNGGVRIHGSSSRQRPQKSLRIYARGEYDRQDSFTYPLFSLDEDEPSKQEHLVYEAFLLRNSGQDWMISMMRDILGQALASQTEVDTQASRPMIVFLNGEYWGVYHLQERYDLAYLRNHFGVEPEQATILSNNQELFQGEAAGVSHYAALLDFIKGHELTDNRNYRYVQSQMDMDNYIDYLIANIFMGNTDWPHNNLYYWRRNTDGNISNAANGQDGRWRWMLFDLDYTFGFLGIDGGVEHNTLALAQQEDWTGFLFRSLLQNQSFRDRFINRCADLMNTVYKAEHVLAAIDASQALLAPEMKEHMQRWEDNPDAVQEWEKEIEGMRLFARKRPEVLRRQIIERFGLKGLANLYIQVDPSMGTVRVNSLEISPTTPGVENAAGWSGVYFQDVPLTISAIPKPGYHFAGWQGFAASEAQITLELQKDLALSAVFLKE